MKNVDNVLDENVSVTNQTVEHIIDMTSGLFYQIFVKWTKTAGTLSGSTKLQESPDGINYVDISGASQAIGDGSGQALFKNTTEFTGKKLKLVTTISNTGVCTLYSYGFSKGI